MGYRQSGRFGDLIEWADIIFVMETVHKRRLNQKYAALLRRRRVIVLNIRDDYEYMDERLVTMLNQTVTPYLRS
jgi:predicted protein tyrosine phosphatase